MPMIDSERSLKARNNQAVVTTRGAMARFQLRGSMADTFVHTFSL